MTPPDEQPERKERKEMPTLQRPTREQCACWLENAMRAASHCCGDVELGWCEAEDILAHLRASPAEPAGTGGDVIGRLRKDIASGLITALRDQRQIDEEGTDVGVSRQAVCEAADYLEALAALAPASAAGELPHYTDDVFEAGVALLEKLAAGPNAWDYADEGGRERPVLCVVEAQALLARLRLSRSTALPALTEAQREALNTAVAMMLDIAAHGTTHERAKGEAMAATLRSLAGGK
jgi:hypothetical protein